MMDFNLEELRAIEIGLITRSAQLLGFSRTEQVFSSDQCDSFEAQARQYQQVASKVAGYKRELIEKEEKAQEAKRIKSIYDETDWV